MEETRKSFKWTRVHFETIGDVVSLLDREEDREFLADAFVERLKNTNESFDENRFRKACAVRIKEMNRTWRN
jgi:hypothetical protein